MNDLVEKAGLAYDAGDYLTAVDLCQQSIKLNHDVDNATLLLASIYGEHGDTDNAIALIDDLLKNSPDLARAHLIKGLIHNHLGEHDIALHHFRKAVALDPRDLESGFALAACLTALGENTQAIEASLATEKHYPDEKEIKRMLAQLYELTQQRDEALRYHLQYLEHEPADADVCHRVSSLYLQQGLHAQSLLYCEKAQASSVDSLDLKLHKADILERWGDHEGAYELVREYLENGEVNDIALIIFGKICYLLDMVDEGKILLRHALTHHDLDNDHRQAMVEILNFLEREGWSSYQTNTT